MTQGVPQTLHANLMIRTLNGHIQHIAFGPIASRESIKHLSTNGGGFLAEILQHLLKIQIFGAIL